MIEQCAYGAGPQYATDLENSGVNVVCCELCRICLYWIWISGFLYFRKVSSRKLIVLLLENLSDIVNT